MGCEGPRRIIYYCRAGFSPPQFAKLDPTEFFEAPLLNKAGPAGHRNQGPSG